MSKENSKLDKENPLFVYEFTQVSRKDNDPLGDLEYKTHNFLSVLTMEETARKFTKRGHKVELHIDTNRPRNSIMYIDYKSIHNDDLEDSGFWITPAVVIDMSIGDVSLTIEKGTK